MIIQFAGGVKERKVSRVTMGFLGCVHTIVSDMRKEKKVNDALSLGQTGFEMPLGPPRYTDRGMSVLFRASIWAGVTKVELLALRC